MPSRATPPSTTLLCVPIMAGDVNRALAEAREARAQGADLVEFRVDPLFHVEPFEQAARAAARLVDESPLPCIITCRAASEGGEYDGPDDERVALWEHLGVAGGGALRPKLPPRYIDIELAAYRRSANIRQKISLATGSGRDSAASLILSTHDLSGRPANLSRLIAEMRACESAAVLKVAWRGRSIRDNVEAFEVLGRRDRPTIALVMGEFGLMSRVLAAKFGGFLTFASLRDESATAPGQPTLRDLLGVYRFRAIGPATRTFGVIGWPVAHSLSPCLHNAAFGESGFDGVLLPMPVPPEWEHFKATLHALLDFPPLDFRGAAVTIPHKEHVVRFARGDASRRWTIDPLADRCGAANTIVVTDDGSCRAMNTDAPAAVETLRGVMGPIEGRRVALIGAGGVARAIGFGVVEGGASVAIVNRSKGRAERLAADLNARRAGSASAGGLTGGRVDAVVNCTPIGMKGSPKEAETALSRQDLDSLPGDAVVFDTVYNPPDTPLLKAAQARGLKTVSGGPMFVLQAALQFEAWTGQTAPCALFDRLWRETTGPTPP